MTRFRRIASFASALALLALLVVPAAATAAPAAPSPQEPALSHADEGMFAQAVGLEIGTDCLDSAFAASTWTCEDECDETMRGCHEIWCSEMYDPWKCNQCFTDWDACMNAC